MLEMRMTDNLIIARRYEPHAVEMEVILTSDPLFFLEKIRERNDVDEVAMYTKDGRKSECYLVDEMSPSTFIGMDRAYAYVSVFTIMYDKDFDFDEQILEITKGKSLSW